MDNNRQIKISNQIRKDLSEILNSLGPKFAPGKMLTVTTVRVSPDLGLAKVYVSIFPSGEAHKDIGLLNDNVAPIRHELGNRMRHQVRIIPELVFYLDDSLDYIERIDELLKK